MPLISILALTAFVVTAQTQTSPSSASQLSEYQVLKTDFCKDKPSEQELKVPTFFAWSFLMKNKVDSLIFDPKAVCIQVGQKVKLLREDTNQPLAEVTPKLIKIFNSKNSAEKHIHLQHMVADFRIKSSEKNAPYALVQLEINKLLFDDPAFFSAVPPDMPKLAQVIDLPRFKALLKAKPFIAVIESENYADERTQLGKTHRVPVSTELQTVFFNGYGSHLRAGQAAFDIKDLPSNKYAPIVLLGDDRRDIFSAQMVYLLSELGYGNIFVFQDGLMGLSQKFSAPPEKANGYITIDANETKRQILLASTVIDLRSPNEEFFQFHIPSTKAVPYLESDKSPRSLKFTTQNLESDRFDKTQLPSNKTGMLIFMGTDSLDWRPYKAAFLAQQNGYINVRIFRGGAAEWYLGHLKDAQKFSIDSNSEKPQSALRDRSADQSVTSVATKSLPSFSLAQGDSVQ